MAGVRMKALGGLLLAMTSLWLAPAALAAPPANDDLANPQALAGALPINAGGTNVEATKEGGEPISREMGFVLDNAGRSVWYSWTAPDTEWVTVSTCESGFDSLVDVYMGTAFFNLEEVAEGHQGPWFDCGFGGSQVTFPAVAGTTYAIRVDGDFSPLPPEPFEGSIALKIASTPSPANDAFATAQTVTSESFEGGTFHRVDVPGFNWNATKEAGEPAHGGDPGGGSVWYSWTPPATGKARVAVVAGSLEPAFDVYTGDSLTGLTSVASRTYFPDTVEIAAIAGTTYRIAIDGRLDSTTGKPAVGQFTFLIYLESSLPVESSLPTVDATPPETKIKRVVGQKRGVTLRFASSEARSSFRCKRDGLRFAACASPKTYSGLKPGRHTFKVVAIDAAGNADPTPATSSFNIPKPQRRQR